AGGVLAAVGDEQVVNVVRLAVLVAHAVARLFAHAAGAHVVGGRVGWRAHDARRPGGFVNGCTLLVRVLTHGVVVRVAGVVDVGRRQAVLVAAVHIERDAVVRARQVLADDPHARHVGVLVDGRGEIAAPGTRFK